MKGKKSSKSQTQHPLPPPQQENLMTYVKDSAIIPPCIKYDVTLVEFIP